MSHAYTWFIAWSSKRERDVVMMNEKSVCLRSWINPVIGEQLQG